MAQSSWFQNARLIIGDGTTIENASILVVDGRIVAVGDVAVSAGQDIEVVNLAGRTVMPALIDGHAHLGYQGPRTWGAESYGRENLIENLQRYAYYGFGAVFSAGSDPAELMLELQSALDAGEFSGARPLFAAGMAPPGEGPNNQFLAHVLDVESETGTSILYGLADPAQARTAVDQAAGRGYRFVKLWVDDRGGTQQKLTPAIYRAVVEAADSHGLRVFVHQQYPADMPLLLDAGVDGFLHGRLGAEFDLALANQTATSGAFVVPNLGLGELRREAIGDDSFLQETLLEAVLTPMSAGVAGRVVNPRRDPDQESELAASFARLLEAGVDIVLGTDAGAVLNHPFGYTGHRELEIYVRLGMSEMKALQAATSVAAHHLGLEDRGLLAPGYRADLLILRDNPLDDIRNTRTIESVYLQGLRLDRDALRDSWMEIAQ